MKWQHDSILDPDCLIKKNKLSETTKPICFETLQPYMNRIDDLVRVSTNSPHLLLIMLVNMDTLVILNLNINIKIYNIIILNISTVMLE